MFFRCLLLSLLGLHVLDLNAGEVKDVYVGHVEIADQSTRTLQQANIAAMRQVLVKASGDPLALEHDLVKRSLQQAANYMRSYRFVREDNRLIYRAEFDVQSMQSLLLGAGFSIWDSRRPDTLIWIATEQQEAGSRELLSENSQNSLLTVIGDIAQSRGIPISFPLMDLDDLQAISMYDVWGGFSDIIQQASARYGADYIVAGRIFYQQPESVDTPATSQIDLESIPVYAVDTVTNAREPSAIDQLVEQIEAEQQNIQPGWVADYQIIFGDSIQRLRVYGDSAEGLGKVIIEQLADMLASTYAFRNQDISPDDKHVDITITNVDGLATLVNVRNFLSSLSVVSAAHLREQSSQSSTFTLELIGTRQDLLNALRLDDKIRPNLDEFGRETQLMRYYWVQ